MPALPGSLPRLASSEPSTVACANAHLLSWFAPDALLHRKRAFLLREISQERREYRLAINRQKKEELVARYKELIKNSSALVFTNYKGTKVSQVRSLRVKLKDTNTTYVVVKNTLLGIALEGKRSRGARALAQRHQWRGILGRRYRQKCHGAERLDQERQGARSHRRAAGDIGRRRQGRRIVV